MKLGLMLGYSGAKMQLPVALVQRAEALGYDSVWTAEAYGSDAITPLAYLGALTRKIRLGTAIAQLAARTPANLAMCAQTIDAMCGEGRMIVGIGVSGPQIVEGWYGQPWGKPNYRLRDTVAIIKKILRREGPVVHEGREISLPYKGPGSSGLGKPLKSILHGNPDIPVVLGTFTDVNIRMTAEIADGWLAGTKWIPSTAQRFSRLVEEGLARRKDGRTLKDFSIYGFAPVHLTGDVKGALDAIKPHVALYVGGMGAKEKNFHKEQMIARGYADAANRIQELFLAGRKDEAAAAVPDEFVDEGALVGPADRVKERFGMWRDTERYGLKGLMLSDANEEILALMAKVANG
jgi:F420-dependent oxidoreductase-like protein